MIRISNYAILRLNKTKTNQSISGIESHCERLSGVYETNHLIRPELTKLNYHLYKSEDGYLQTIKNRISEVGCKARKDSVMMIYGFVSGSYRYIIQMSTEEQREFFSWALEFIKDRFGKDNLISAVVHMDENAPHMHFALVPISEEGRLQGAVMLGNYEEIRQKNKDFYYHMSSRFTDLDEPYFNGGKSDVKITPQMYRKAACLITKLNLLRTAARDINVFNMEKKKLEINEMALEIEKDASDVRGKLEQSGKYIGEIEEELQIKMNELDVQTDIQKGLYEQIREKKNKIAEMENEKQESLLEITRLRNMLSMIPGDIRHEHLKGEKQFKDVFDLDSREEVSV